jgi:hypothetical protein
MIPSFFLVHFSIAKYGDEIKGTDLFKLLLKYYGDSAVISS